MIKEYRIWEKGEYHYPAAYGFIPKITCYLHEDDKVRRAMIIVPGGGYTIVSPTEAEIVAKRFFREGYQTFVMTYTTNFLHNEPLKYQPLCDLSRAVRLIRKNAREFWINENQVIVCGFSAGAHLTGSLGVHFTDIDDQNPAYGKFSNKPSGIILCCPVISCKKYGHADSMDALLGKDASHAEKYYMSLEEHVNSETPPSFVWQMSEDEVVSPVNSLLYVHACLMKKVKIYYHLYTGKGHALSTADENWKKGRYGDTYTLEQMLCTLRAGDRGIVHLTEEALEISKMTNEWVKPQPGNEEISCLVSGWTEEAVQWLNELFV